VTAGKKHSHREGLYQCRPCRRQFSVTVGTPFERLHVPLSTWMVAAREFSADDTRRAHNARRGDNLVPLTELQTRIRVSYKTVLRMRDIIKQAAKRYKGHKTGFGAWPRSFMKSRTIHARSLQGYLTKRDALFAAGRHPAQHTIKATGVLLTYAEKDGVTEAALKRTECLLRLLLVLPKAA
jgi:transposase-like protein